MFVVIVFITYFPMHSYPVNIFANSVTLTMCCFRANADKTNIPFLIIIIIKGHSLRRACLQPATSTQNSKPRPPTTNARSKGKRKKQRKKTLLETQHRLTTPLHTCNAVPRFAQSRGRSICPNRYRFILTRCIVN